MKLLNKITFGSNKTRTYDIGNTTYIVSSVYNHNVSFKDNDNSIVSNLSKFIKSEIADFTEYLTNDTIDNENVPTVEKEA
ncbi:MAG TPA: hypothetical protein DDY98_05540 [Ruminococcaceae bacterium]|nr:hypothetical protein [Oscillospiraceae bacterium]